MKTVELDKRVEIIAQTPYYTVFFLTHTKNGKDKSDFWLIGPTKLSDQSDQTIIYTDVEDYAHMETIAGIIEAVKKLPLNETTKPSVKSLLYQLGASV